MRDKLEVKGSGNQKLPSFRSQSILLRVYTRYEIKGPGKRLKDGICRRHIIAIPS